MRGGPICGLVRPARFGACRGSPWWQRSAGLPGCRSFRSCDRTRSGVHYSVARRSSLLKSFMEKGRPEERPLWLLAKAELRDEVGIPLTVLVAEIVEQRAALV